MSKRPLSSPGHHPLSPALKKRKQNRRSVCNITVAFNKNHEIPSEIWKLWVLPFITECGFPIFALLSKPVSYQSEEPNWKCASYEYKVDNSRTTLQSQPRVFRASRETSEKCRYVCCVSGMWDENVWWLTKVRSIDFSPDLKTLAISKPAGGPFSRTWENILFSLEGSGVQRHRLQFSLVGMERSDSPCAVGIEYWIWVVHLATLSLRQLLHKLAALRDFVWR